MKKAAFAIIFTFIAVCLRAQRSDQAYSFLQLPASAHVAALGGDNISIVEDDPALIFHNPSLITSVSDKTINLNYMTYMEGSKAASASFVRAYKDKATWGVMAQYLDYGTIKEVTSDNVHTGDFSAKDIMIGASFAYNLSSKIAGGISAKYISSHIAGFSSLAVAVDLGLNYYDESKGLSISAVARNLGGQVKAYEDDFEKLPLDLQLGVTKKLGNAPLRFSASVVGLNDWDGGLKNHLVIGAEVLLSSSIYVAGGYNFRRANEMKISDGEGESSHGAGLSFGGGVQLQRIKFNVAYAKYHVSASSLLFNASYTL